LSDAQHVIVALDIAGPVLEPVTTELLLPKLVLLGVVLDHGTHGTIIHGNPRIEQVCDVCTETVPPTDKVGEAFRIG